MKEHFVTFYSPGTFVPETTGKPIKSWHVPSAVRMARTIKERYDARPYAFKFTTYSRGKMVAESGLYYLGGKIETLADVEARNDPKEAILRDNMRFNSIDRIIVNNNSWRFTGQFHDGDTLLDVRL